MRKTTITLLMLSACAGAPSTPPAPPADPPADPSTDPTTSPSRPVTDPQTGTKPAARAPADAILQRLANGVTVTILPHNRGDLAQVQLALLAGSDFAAPGVAELTAEVFVSSGDATTGRVSVRQAITKAGGTVTVEVHPLTTWITIRVPPFRWQQAQSALADALAAPALSRSQIERVRDEYVLRRIRDVWSSPDREVPRAFLLGSSGTSPYIASLLDRDPSEITLFASRLYRSDSTLLTLRVPGGSAEIIEQLRAGIGKWPAPTVARAEVPAEARRLVNGLYWAPSDPPQACRATVVLPLPDDADPMAAELFALHACLTLDGIGGRLEDLQQRRGLGHLMWRSEVIDIATTPAIALTTEMTPADAVAVWEIVQAARQSLLDLPPTPSELQLAVRRARLTAQLLATNADTRGRIAAWRLIRGQAPDALDRRMDALAAPEAFRAKQAARAYLRLPAAVIVLGGQVPENTEHRQFELLPTGALARLASSDPIVQSEAAAPWLDRAIEAIGGSALLRRFNGFEFSATLRGEGAPETTEELQWNRNSGAITRSREVLGTRIEASITKQAAVEQSGETTAKIPPHEVALLRRELARHPVSLLAACARGELRFRPVSQRTVGDRDFMILEAVGEQFDRLRIHVDTVSYLVRLVEVWESTNDGTVYHVRDAWSDYRNSAAAVRTPFRRITEHDDGRNRIEAVYSRWEPLSRK